MANNHAFSTSPEPTVLMLLKSKDPLLAQIFFSTGGGAKVRVEYCAEEQSS